MRISDLLSWQTATDSDVRYLAKFVPLCSNVYRLPAPGRALDGFEMRWLRKHTRSGARPTRRVWVCGFVVFRDVPVALLHCGGREGDDDGHLLIVDRDGFVELLRALTGRWTIRLHETGPWIERSDPYLSLSVSFVDPSHHDPRAGNVYGSCLLCDWHADTDLDVFDGQPLPAEGCRLDGCKETSWRDSLGFRRAARIIP